MASPQKCLYEILGLEPSSTVEEIRSAYRKLALKWHPDKIQQSGASPQACQEATLHFQEIGRAYEVLADPGERSWYDSHRSQILSSSSSPSGAPPDYDFNLWPFFSPTVFSGYGDTGKGFYAVYKDVFLKLHLQEKAFARAYSLSSIGDPPDMGSAGTPYPQVSKFYGYWLGFSTVKDFSWCDEYRTTSAPNRKVRRLMEEENKKIRSKARKEFNDAVRRLAAFVKKRDKRVLERQLEVQRREKEKEQMLKLRRQKEEAERLLKAKQYEEAEWTKASDGEEDEKSDVDDSIGSYDWGRKAAKSSRQDKQEEYYCIICSKKFKSDEQWRNHERSKKHIEQVASLKESFQGVETGSLSPRPQDDSWAEASNEEVLEGSNGRETAISSVVTSGNVEKEVLSTQECSSSDVDGEDDESSSLSAMLNSYNSRRQKHPDERDSGSDGEQYVDALESAKEGEEDDEILAAMMKSHLNRQQLEDVGRDASVPKEHFLNVPGEVEEEIGEDLSKCKSKAKVRAERKQAASSGRYARLTEALSLQKQVDKMVLNSDNLGIDEGAHVLKEEPQDEPKLAEVPPSLDSAHLKNLLENTPDTKYVPAVDKKENRKLKGNKVTNSAIAQKDQAMSLMKGKKMKGGSKNLTNTCETCGEDFETRNQLFKHISTTKHAALRGK